MLTSADGSVVVLVLVHVFDKFCKVNGKDNHRMPNGSSFSEADPLVSKRSRTSFSCGQL
jgi:hypothetical protein